MGEHAIAGAAVERRMSLAEWAAMPEDEPGELVDGRLTEEEVPDFVHELTVAWLIHLLHAWITPRGGFVGGSEVKFAVRPSRGRKPDISLFFPGRRPPARGVVSIPPDIMVEVVSPTPRDGRRDRVEKLSEYASFGVRWYWLVDPAFRSVEIFKLGEDGYYARVLGETGGTHAVPGCDGLCIDIDALWAELDRLEPEPESAP